MTAWRFLFFSLFVHLLVWLWLANRPATPLPQKNDAVTFTVIDKSKKEDRQKTLVRQNLLPPDMLNPEPPKNPKYFSEKTQSVKKEMKAQNSGLTHNSPTLAKLMPQFKVPPPEDSDAAKEESQHQNENLEKAPDGMMAAEKNQSKKQDRLKKLGHKFFAADTSANGEYLPDVNEGPINALNSERFVYYSFFARIEERIRPLWERNVQDVHEHMPLNVQRKFADQDWVTGLEIILNAHGDYEKTIVQQSSGVDAVDRTAIEAFSEAAYFPNPPKEMLKEDGKIHLKYAFIVQQRSSIWARRGGS